MPFGPKYDTATLQGYAALQRRFAAVSKVTDGLMRDLGKAAIRNQKKLLYTEAVRRRTGHSGQLITLGAVTPSSALTEARGTAMWADTGTKPHLIKPKAAKVLAWATSSSKGFRLTGKPSSAKGNKVGFAFAMVVHHPGTKPHPYMVRGAQMAITGANLGDRVTTAWDGAA